MSSQLAGLVGLSVLVAILVVVVVVVLALVVLFSDGEDEGW